MSLTGQLRCRAAPSTADIQIGWADFNTSASHIVGYTTLQQSGGWLIAGTTVQLEDPNETALVPGPDGQFTYANTDTTLSQAALHEIGHALGFGDDSDPNSVMYYALGASNQTLASTDIAMAQLAYGPNSIAALSRTVQAMASFNAQTAVTTVPQPLVPPQDPSTIMASSAVH